MADYSEFSTEDFVTDADFCAWVLRPTPESERFWQAFLEAHPHQTANIHQAKALVRGIRMDWHEVTDDQALQSYQRLRNRLQQPVQTPHVHRFALYRSVAVAATILAFLCMAGWWYTQRMSGIQVQTGFGEVKTVQLPDGSTVLLNSNSRLVYQNDWAEQGRRTVQLEGEAYFRVSHQEIKAPGGLRAVKFVVRANDINVEVVGTEFTVKNRRTLTQVSLFKGKVQLLSSQNLPPVVMKPGETAEFDKVQSQIVFRNKPAETVWAWHQNKLVFKAATLREVAQTLQDNYGLTLVFAQDTLASQQFTGEVAEGKVEVLLTAIAETFDCQIRKEDDRIILSR
jgi:ferric-dicitrate binding protein FerR (iron transport regulator)